MTAKSNIITINVSEDPTTIRFLVLVLQRMYPKDVNAVEHLEARRIDIQTSNPKNVRDFLARYHIDYTESAA